MCREGRSPAWPRWLVLSLLIVTGCAPSEISTEAPPPEVPGRPSQALESVVLAPVARAAELQAPLPSPVPVRPVPTASNPLPAAARRQASEALVASLKSDLAATWVKNHRDTELRGGPSDAAPIFNSVPQWTLLKRLEERGDWTLVYSEGDGAERQPGPGWVRAADLGLVGAPPLWVASRTGTPLWSSDETSARKLLELPAGARMELLGREAFSGVRMKVRLPGDGRLVPPSEGWIEAGDAARTRTPASAQLPWAYPRAVAAEVRLTVPYRTQIDGSPYAGANCGPSVLGMAMETFGINVPPRELRTRVLQAQDGEPWEDDAGSFIWALADVAQRYGLKTYGLYEPDGMTLRRWSAEDVRGELRSGHPVILQVRYRGLPRRGDSDYYGDHYIVATGLLGSDFLYNDSIWGTSETEGPGFDRVMTEPELLRAMNASDRPYAYSGFALSR